MTAERTLSQRELNRALLARQLLLDRARMPAADAIEQVAGLQAQAFAPPFIGLWTRLEGFDEAELQGLIDGREVVRATMMRHTIHFVTAGDYLRLRGPIQPALDRAWWGQVSKRLAGYDVEPVWRAAHDLFARGPATFADVAKLIEEMDPASDVRALAYGVRTKLRLVGVPNSSRWRFGGKAPFALAEEWLGRPIPGDDDPRELVRRYLAAFGPGTPADATAWSRVGAMKAVFEAMRGELVTYRDEAGRELFDLPGAPLPDPQTPAPARFLPEFDNTLLSHKDRTRVIADEHRPRVYIVPGRVIGTLLLDGFVAAGWRIERTKADATLVIEPFRKLTRAERRELEPEGERLVAFAEPDAASTAIRYLELQP